MDVWTLGRLLRKGPLPGTVRVGDQCWTAVATSVMRLVLENAGQRDGMYIVRLRLYGSYERERRVFIVLDEGQIDCPQLSADITRTVTEWLPRSCGSGHMVFRPGCQLHPTCRTSLVPERWLAAALPMTSRRDG